MWTREHTKSFNELKEALTQAPVLAFPQEGALFILDTDASAYGIGGVLSQLQEGEGEEEKLERPIAFH